MTLADVAFDADSKTLSIDIEPDGEAKYTVDFIATLASGDADDRIGKRVARVEGLSARYTMQGNELYVRAVVTSSLPPVDPVFDDQKQKAWTQPVGW